MLPLLQTCTFVYAEAIELLYKIPTFLVSDMDVLRGWNESVLAMRFAAVRTLNLSMSITLQRNGDGRRSLQDDDRWQGLWHVLRGMEGLRKLRVRLICGVREILWDLEGQVLDSLERLRQVLDLEVLIQWEYPEGRVVHKITQGHVRLVRSVSGDLRDRLEDLTAYTFFLENTYAR